MFAAAFFNSIPPEFKTTWVAKLFAVVFAEFAVEFAVFAVDWAELAAVSSVNPLSLFKSDISISPGFAIVIVPATDSVPALPSNFINWLAFPIAKSYPLLPSCPKKKPAVLSAKSSLPLDFIEPPLPIVIPPPVSVTPDISPSCAWVCEFLFSTFPKPTSPAVVLVFNVLVEFKLVPPIWTVPLKVASPPDVKEILLPIVIVPSAANTILLLVLFLKLIAPLVIWTLDLLEPTSPIITSVPNLEAVTLPAISVIPSAFRIAFSSLSLAP